VPKWMCLAAAAFAAASAGCAKEAEHKPPPPPEVYVAQVVQKDVPIYLDLVGQTEGYKDVEIRARVEGWLETMNFREGSFVREGDLLYQIDRKPLEAMVAQAKADKANARAKLEKAANDVARYTPLVAKQAVSQRELDDARAALDAARAQVDAAAAAETKATLDLGYTRVTAPISGLIGASQVKPGNLVGKGEATLLTTISQIDPIIFRVGIAEADFLRLSRRNPARPGRKPEGKKPESGNIELTLSDGSAFAYKGRVGVVERQVNAATGTLGVQIYFPNPELLLRPGQYGHIRALLDTQRNALLVPQRAVQELQNLFSVAVVAPDNTVTFRNVKVGQRLDGGMWVIDKGLQPTDRVVVEGLQRVAENMTVRPKTAAEPAPVATTGKSPAEHK
jgi:membrane fusion protein, multidrug efflux system